MAARPGKPRGSATQGDDKALTRFYLDTTWNGEEMLLQSRAMDETGYVQPTKAQLREVRGRELGLPQQLHPDLVGQAERGGGKCRSFLKLSRAGRV